MALRNPIKAIQEFIKLESSSGIILLAMILLALVLDNSPLQSFYHSLLSFPIGLSFGDLSFIKSMHLWVNEGLMAIFFLLVGLEIKREAIEGELNTRAKLTLPAFAAVGGMVVPAVIYLLINLHNHDALRGWAIPSATDIAFSLGILALLGKRVPLSLKVFLTAIAILDDLGAIIIIACIYTSKLSILSIGLALECLLILLIFNVRGVTARTPYLLIGILLWFFVLNSGVHATLAGVAVAIAYPLTSKHDPKFFPLKVLEKKLHPWVAFIILPVFAFFNAGISFAGVYKQHFVDQVTLGIVLGLFIGKQLGIFGATWLAVKLKIAELPDKLNWRWVYGTAILCGIGFTMSLFIGNLAFNGNSSDYITELKLGVFIGSLLSGITGYLVLLGISKHYYKKQS